MIITFAEELIKTGRLGKRNAQTHSWKLTDKILFWNFLAQIFSSTSQFEVIFEIGQFLIDLKI